MNRMAGNNNNNLDKTTFKMIRFIIVAAKKLNMSDVGLATSAMIYHRFANALKQREEEEESNNNSRNQKQFDPFLIAMTCIYLSSKVEEEADVRLRNIVNVCYRTYHADLAPLELDETYWTLRHSVMQTELVIVRMLSFRMAFDHPHRYLLNYLEALAHWIPLTTADNHQATSPPIAEVCWSMLRDLLHSASIFQKYRPQEIAIALIYFALQIYGVRVPFNSSAEYAWYESLDEKVDRQIIQEIINEILDVYDFEQQICCNDKDDSDINKFK